MRKALGIGQTDFVVFLAGQPVGDDEVLGVVVQGLKARAPSWFLIMKALLCTHVRCHPS